MRRNHTRNPGIRIRHWCPFWYLFALFFGKMLLAVVNQFRHPAILVLGLFFCGNVLAQIIWLPWSILQALSATLFFVHWTDY